MATQTIFSKDYYRNGWMFYNQMQLVEKTPDGGAKFVSDSFTNLWQHRTIHAIVDESGAIATTPFSFFEHLKRYFSLTQDQNLIAVHRKLKHLESELQNPLSLELQRLRQEIHNEGARGAEILKHNLHLLSACFEKANDKNFFTLTLLKVLNFIRKLFYAQPIDFTHFESINQNLFLERAVRPALELSLTERAGSKFLPIIQNHSSFPLPPELNSENLKKLEYGLLNELSFQIDQKCFLVSYDRTREEFILSYCGSGENQSSLPTLFDKKENYTFRSDPLNIMERSLDGTTTIRPLHHSVEYTYERGPWYNPFLETHNYCFNPGKLVLTANYEYTIPLSRGNFSLRMCRRVL